MKPVLLLHFSLRATYRRHKLILKMGGEITMALLTAQKVVPLCGGGPTTDTIEMQLTDLLAAYLGGRDCGIRYRESLNRTVRKMLEAGITSVGDLKPEHLNRFLCGLSSLTATTRQNIRREALTLWRYAFEERWTDEPPLRVMRIRSAPKPTSAWPMQTLERMLKCAESDETVVSKRHRMLVCDFLPAWITIAYDSGLRFQDVYDLRAEQIRDCAVVGVAHKTRKTFIRPLSEYAVCQAKVLGARSPDGSLFRWFLTRRRAFLTMKEFRGRHKIDGTMKYLRRSCATLIEKEKPGSARQYLQHGDGATTTRHYIDESLLAVPEGPPPIR